MSACVASLALALAHLRSGRPDQAQTVLRALLQEEPDNAEALHLLGSLAYEHGRWQEALEQFRRASEAEPGNSTYVSCQGAALQALGQRQEALACHRRAEKLSPEDALVLNNLGITLASLEERSEAIQVFRRAQQANPQDAAVLCNLVAVLRQDYAEEAEALSRKALTIQPRLAQAHNNLGSLLQDRGQLEEAAACFERAVSLAPNFATAWQGLGSVYQKLGRPREAAHALRRALEIEPGAARTQARLGHALLTMERVAEAVAACEQAVRLGPEEAEAHNDLGNARVRQGALDEAEASYREAVRLRPEWAVPHYNLGVALLAQGQADEARASLQEAMRLDPDDPVAHSTFVGALHYDPACDGRMLLAEHRRWAEQHARLSRQGGHTNQADSERRLRVGYVSPDFRSHAVAFFLAPILAHHDPRQVEVFCYSDVLAPDEVTARLRRLVPHWCDSAGLSDEQLSERVRADGIDVLVDLCGHLAGNRLRVFARRPAPVQVSYLGYPGTTGLDAIDYRLVDAVTDPEGEEPLHSEQLFRLPGPFCCYGPPPRVRRAATLPERHQGFPTFGSLHKLEKINERVIDLWAEVLRRVPGARLLLARNTLHGATAARLRTAFVSRGIDAERLLLERAEPVSQRHLDLYERVDVALDTFPWSGHLTACEALARGVPVVTLRGDRHAGRMVASVLTAVGLRDLVADTPEHYVAIASKLIADQPRRAVLRGSLPGKLRTSSLCDGARFTKSLEAAYREMWRRWCGI